MSGEAPDVSLAPCSPSIFPTGRGQVTCCPAKWNSASQPTREIWEPGETFPNLFGFPEEADGCKGPLLEPKLRFLVESRPRKVVHSGSLCRTPCWLKKRCTTWEFRVKFYLQQTADCSRGGTTSDTSLEQSLRPVWDDASRTAVCILPQIKLNWQLSHCVSFLVDTFYIVQ